MSKHIFQRVLALSPHTDDIEFGCGATLSRLRDAGATVLSIAFSAAEESVPDGFPKDILRTEFISAHGELGIPPDQCRALTFRVRHFPKYRQEILEELVKLNKCYEPNLVLVPSTTDTHQDHKTIAEEAYRAFKRTSIWAYEVPWNQQVSRLNGFFSIDEKDLNRKLAAIASYKSQQHRTYVSPDFVRSLAVVRGSQIGSELAEAFEVVKHIHRYY
jgi:LmbE family N-acetylglucosaminyl deacetylase